MGVQHVPTISRAWRVRIKQALAPVLVLDGFEVAQYVQQHQEIWQVLDLILAQVPTLRVIVSGRAPVANLMLYGRPARTHHLKGMAREDAEAWLREHGIVDESVLAIVLDISVSAFDDRVVHYLTDTKEGSSGAPVFDAEGHLIALHHAGGRPQEIAGKAPLKKNEGIRISRILAGLGGQNVVMP
jgi:hypothetical protein